MCFVRFCFTPREEPQKLTLCIIETTPHLTHRELLQYLRSVHLIPSVKGKSTERAYAHLQESPHEGDRGRQSEARGGEQDVRGSVSRRRLVEQLRSSPSSGQLLLLYAPPRPAVLNPLRRSAAFVRPLSCRLSSPCDAFSAGLSDLLLMWASPHSNL